MRIPSCAKFIVCKFQRVSSNVRIPLKLALFVRLKGDLKCSVTLLAMRIGVSICSIRPSWWSSARYGLVDVGVLMRVPSIVRILLCAFFYAFYCADSCADYCAYTIVQISCTNPTKQTLPCVPLCGFLHSDFIVQILSLCANFHRVNLNHRVHYRVLYYVLYCMLYCVQVLSCGFLSWAFYRGHFLVSCSPVAGRLSILRKYRANYRALYCVNYCVLYHVLYCALYCVQVFYRLVAILNVL